MTTIFCRSDSKFFTELPKRNPLDLAFGNLTRKLNKKFRNSDREISTKQILNKLGLSNIKSFNKNELSNLNTFKDASFYCAIKYIYDEIKRVLDHYGIIQYVSETFEEGNQAIKFFKSEGKFTEIREMNDLDVDKPFLISSVEFWKFEQHEKVKSYKTRLQYTYPVVILLPDDFSLDLEKILRKVAN